MVCVHCSKFTFPHFSVSSFHFFLACLTLLPQYVLCFVPHVREAHFCSVLSEEQRAERQTVYVILDIDDVLFIF